MDIDIDYIDYIDYMILILITEWMLKYRKFHID